MAEPGCRCYHRDFTIFFIRDISLMKYCEMEYQYHWGRASNAHVFCAEEFRCIHWMHWIRRCLTSVILGYPGCSQPRWWKAMWKPWHSWDCLRGASCMVWAGYCQTLNSALDKCVHGFLLLVFSSCLVLKSNHIVFVEMKREKSTWENQQGNVRSLCFLDFSPVLLSSRWNLLSFNFFDSSYSLGT